MQCWAYNIRYAVIINHPQSAPSSYERYAIIRTTPTELVRQFLFCNHNVLSLTACKNLYIDFLNLSLARWVHSTHIFSFFYSGCRFFIVVASFLRDCVITRMYMYTHKFGKKKMDRIICGEKREWHWM